MPKKHGDDDVGGAELREVAVGGHDFDDGVAAEVLVEELGDDDGDGQVLDALDDVAGDGDVAQERPHVAVKYGLGHAQCYVRPHVEQRPAELLNRHRLHVAPHRQWREPIAPRLVVRFHRLE